jgi:nicotinate-nucleotide adenylyltransferase
MGADNLIQIPAWKNWQELFHTLPVAVFNRPSYHLRALAGKAARRFARHRVPEKRAARLAGKAPPAWVFIHQGLNAQSSTRIRAARKGRARRT